MARLTGAARSIGALAVLTAMTVGGATVGDAGPTGAAPGPARASSAPPVGVRVEPFPGALSPTVRDSIRAALGRVREHLPLPERAPTREPRRAHRSPAKVAVQYAESGIPVIAWRAYHQAARNIDAELPACHLDWSLLAGIGRIESDHGRFGGALSSPNGDISPAILGPRLTGAGDMARIGDTDNGEYDGDRRLDRAVGPMQFLPGTWAVVGADGNGDGTADPNNIFDAALGAAEYLCAGDRDLARPADLRAAVFSYNHSAAYVAEVLGLATLYRAGRAPQVPTVGGAAGATPSEDRPAPAKKRAGQSKVTHRAGHSNVTQRAERPSKTSPHPSQHRPEADRTTPPPGSDPSPSAPPTSAPPASDPPTSEAPTSDPSNPPSSDPPTSAPPTSDPPTSDPPTSDPPRPDQPAIKGSTDPDIATTATPVFTATGPDGAGQLTYRFKLWPADHEAEGAKMLASGTAQPDPGQPAKWTVPEKNALSDGQDYALRVQVTDDAGTSAWSQWLEFTVTLDSDPSDPPTSDPPPSTPPSDPSGSPSESPGSSPSGDEAPDSPDATPTPTTSPS